MLLHIVENTICLQTYKTAATFKRSKDCYNSRYGRVSEKIGVFDDVWVTGMCACS
jgi:hypothetical protein